MQSLSGDARDNEAGGEIEDSNVHIREWSLLKAMHEMGVASRSWKGWGPDILADKGGYAADSGQSTPQQMRDRSSGENGRVWTRGFLLQSAWVRRGWGPGRTLVSQRRWGEK